MNAGKKKGLGRGLSALFGDDSPKVQDVTKRVGLVLFPSPTFLVQKI